MVDVSGYLNTKYDILRTTANADATLKNAQAGLLQSQTQTNPQEAAARAAQGFGAGAQGQGFGQYYGALAGAEPGIAGSEVGLRGAQAGEAGANTAASQANQQFLGTGISPDLLNLIRGRLGQGGIGTSTGFGSGSGFGGTTNAFATGTSNVPSYDTGVTTVPGEGSGKVDTQPAMLAPHEAVLNTGAAEHLGRGVIDVLNAIGMIKMGQTGGAVEKPGPVTKAPKDGEGGVKGFAQGSADTGRIDPIPGQGGTWEPPPTPPTTGGSLRASLGMGVPRPAPKPAGYAKGTSKVGGKSAGKAEKSNITPAMVEQLLALGRGGGGLMSPGQGAPMPMSMPQVAPGAAR